MSDPGTKNSTISIALCMIGLLAAGVTAYALYSGEAATQPPANTSNNGEQNPVIQTASAKIPPIDRELPEKIETATFAMG